MDQFPQVLLNVKVREPVDPTRDAAVRDAVEASRRSSATAAAWCCVPRARSR